jgi:hypothetical protein
MYIIFQKVDYMLISSLDTSGYRLSNCPLFRQSVRLYRPCLIALLNILNEVLPSLASSCLVKGEERVVTRCSYWELL